MECGFHRKAMVRTWRGKKSGLPSKSFRSSLILLINRGLSLFLTDSSTILFVAKNPGSIKSRKSLKFSGSPLCGVAVKNNKCSQFLDKDSPNL